MLENDEPIVNKFANFDPMGMYLEKAEHAATLDEFELWDAALHQAMASASHNRFVVRILDIVTAVRQQSEWGKVKDRIVIDPRRTRYDASWPRPPERSAASPCHRDRR